MNQSPSRRRSLSRGRRLRSHNRRFIKRSRSLTNKSSRSNSSNCDRCSKSAERHVAKHEKYVKTKKKEKLHEKKSKRKKQHESAPTVKATVTTMAVQEVSNDVSKQTTSLMPVDARNFFEQLQRQEAAKMPVGTVHARGLPAPVSLTALSSLDKWECSKAGCGHLNFKHAPACNKCRI
ncbi:hypothetical protein CCR75_006492 [Bremia lactucae]|uniref:RanBP2-type domain-containing protein n=1 Tax=Bremia lactucae TaxID=4779 RepID=A0A976FRM0_BRELC|nr:hypothetical protein CCR75_006492 [Bremia lactucae]